MSQSSNNSLSTPTPTFVPEIYQMYARRFQLEFVMLGLLVGLYGMLTMLSGLSCYALLTQRSRPTIVLGLTVFSLFTSTTMYTVASILDYQSDFLSSFTTDGLLVWSGGYDSNTISSALKTVPNLTKDYTIFQSCTSATTLTINLLLGDAISRTVKALCGAFLFFTSMVGAVDSTQSCQLWKLDPDPDISGKMGTVFEGVAIGIGACVLSLSTNIFATLLVACKAWQLRRRLRCYLGMGSRISGVQKVLSLLIESGAVYCVLLAVLLTFQVSNLYNGTYEPPGPPAAYFKFLDVFGVIANGALIPMIAIYPTVVIIFVALNKSHMEKGFTQHLESVPTPHITSTADTISGGGRPRHTNINDLEDAGRRGDEELKVEGIA